METTPRSLICLILSMFLVVAFMPRSVRSQGQVTGQCAGTNIAGFQQVTKAKTKLKKSIKTESQSLSNDISQMSNSISNSISMQTQNLKNAIQNGLADVGGEISSLATLNEKLITGKGGLKEHISTVIQKQTNALIKQERSKGLQSSSMPKGACTSFQKGMAARVGEAKTREAASSVQNKLKEHMNSRETESESIKGLAAQSRKDMGAELLFPSNKVLDMESSGDDGSGGSSEEGPQKGSPVEYLANLSNPTPPPKPPENISRSNQMVYDGYSQIYENRMDLVNENLSAVQSSYAPTMSFDGNSKMSMARFLEKMVNERFSDAGWRDSIMTAPNSVTIQKDMAVQMSVQTKLLFEIYENLKRLVATENVEEARRVNDNMGQKLRNLRDKLQ